MVLALSTELGTIKVRTRVKFAQGINPQSVTNIIPQSVIILQLNLVKQG